MAPPGSGTGVADVLPTKASVVDVLNRWQPRPMDYQVMDCCRFVAWAVQELGGGDFGSRLGYRGPDEAAALLARSGGLRGAVVDVLQDFPMDPYMMRAGDVVLWHLRGHEGLGVSLERGARSFAAVMEQGAVVQLSGRHVLEGWRIPYPID